MSKKDQYPECLIGSIVSPGEYWLINKNESHTLQIRKLEEDLSAEMISNGNIPLPDTINSVDYLAVENPSERGSWKRGKVLCKIGKAIFKVFLIDSGYITQVSIKHIRIPIDPKYLEVEPLAFRFCLYGIIPCHIVSDGLRKQVSSTWSEESKYFVKNYLSQKSFVHVNAVRLAKRTVLGDIYLMDKPDGQLFSFSRLLCVKNYALYSESYFKEKVMTLELAFLDDRILELDSEVCFQMDAKIARMEQLRLLGVQFEGDWDGFRAGNDEGNSSDTKSREIKGSSVDKTKSNDSSRLRSEDVFKAYSMRNKLRSRIRPDQSGAGTSMPSHSRNQESHHQVVDGSSNEKRRSEPFEERKPSELLRRKQPPRQVMDVRPQRHLMDPRPPRHLMDPRPPRHLMDPRPPRHLMDPRPPRHLVDPRPPRHLMDSRPPRHLMDSRPPRHLMDSRPPRHLMDSRPPRQMIEKQVPKSQMEKRLPKPFMEKQTPKPMMERHMPKPQAAKQLARPVMEKQIPTSTKENELSDGSDENDISDASEDNERCERLEESASSGQSKEKNEEQSLKPPGANKEFRIIFEEKSGFPKLDVTGSYEIFHLFFDSVLQPIDKFRELNISELILADIEREVTFEDLSPIQRWAIPSIMKGHDLVILGEPKTGKTFSYIFGCLENLRLKMEKEQLRSETGRGPAAVILSSSSRSCEFIQRAITLLTTKKNRKLRISLWNLRVRFINGTITERHSVSQLVNDCDVLISTPHCLVRILKQRSISEFGRLDLVVFDEADISTQEPFLTQMKVLLHQAKLPKNVQKIFCGERWTAELEALTKMFARDHSVVIGSFLEAAVYANLKPEVLHMDHERKDKLLLDLALEKHRGSKVVIVCSKTEEVLHLEKILNDKRKNCSVAHSEMLMQELKNVSHKWERSKQSCVVVCTEDIADDLGIHDAEVLINYSLPSDWRASFSDRFILIIKNIRDYAFERKKKGFPLVIVLIEDRIHFQLPNLMDFLQRLGYQIPYKFRDLCSKVNADIEASKREFPLCENILKYGHCKDGRKCNRRHSFNRAIDSPTKPLCGIIKFRILKVHSTTHFSARIVELSDQQNNYKKIPFHDFSLDISKRLRKYYYRKDHRKILNSVKINALCAVNRCDLSGVKYHRAKILEFKTFRRPDEPTEVVVKLIDWGHVFQVHVSKLFELPEVMKIYPPQSTDIYLCNLMPKDCDLEWSDRTISYAKNMFTRDLENDQIWIGRIKLSLDSLLFVDPVKLCHTLEKEDVFVIEFSASRKLISSGIAEEKPEHLKMVYSMCEKANIDTFIYEYDSDVVGDSGQPDCAFFDNDFLKVQFLFAESLSSLYLRVSKFKDLLRNLEVECNAEGRNQKTSDTSNVKNSSGKKKLAVGTYCLALYESTWNRAKILSFENGRAQVFFIDYGDVEYAENVVPISEKLLTKLPAQAIECYLVGLNSDINTTDKVVEEIYAFSNDGTDELYVSVVEKCVKSQSTGGWKYGINVVNAQGKSLNKKLIDSGLVQPASNHMEIAVDVEMRSKASLDDVDETDLEDTDDEYNVCEDKGKVDLSKTENPTIVGNSANDLTTPCVISKGVDDLSYFLNMKSQVFDDENACCMLEEFVAQLAPEKLEKEAARIEEVTETEEDPPVSQQDAVVTHEGGEGEIDTPHKTSGASSEGKVGETVSQSGEGDSMEEEVQVFSPKDGGASPKENASGSVSRRDEAAPPKGRKNHSLKRRRVRNSGSSLPYMKYFADRSFDTNTNKLLLSTDTFTPEIFWSQTHAEVEVKIMLNNVVNYKLECLVERFIFRCLLDNKMYVSNVKLFGAICPEMTRVEIKTFFVLIVFQKLCPLPWSRLCRDNKKFRWIKYNIEHFTERKCTISEIICSQAIERVKAGNLITPKVTDEVKFVPSSSSESNEWSDSDGDEDLTDKKDDLSPEYDEEKSLSEES